MKTTDWNSRNRMVMSERYNEAQRQYFRAVGAGAFAIAILVMIVCVLLLLKVWSAAFAVSPSGIGFGRIKMLSLIVTIWAGGLSAVVFGAMTLQLQRARNPRETLFSGLALGIGCGLLVASIALVL